MAKRQSKEDIQPDLFGSAAPAPKAYMPNPQHVRNRFIEFMAQMTAAETWPWDEGQIERHRESTWPYLWDKMAEVVGREEAEDWRRQMEAEAARLDAAMLKGV